MILCKLLILTLLVIPRLTTADVDDIPNLNKDNFQTTTGNNKYVLVEFYAPWCGHCQDFAPEYAKTAKILRSNNSPVKIAKVNADEEKDLAAEHGVRGYPTIKLFTNGSPLSYYGNKQADDLINWISKNTGPTYTL